MASKARRLLQADEDVVCYEGCFDPPVDSPTATPLPVFLSSSPTPIQLLDCYTLAAAANLPVFAIYNTTDCYGGPGLPLGWAPDTCPIDCKPNGPAPYICGATAKASIFSLGYCLRVDAPCQPGASPSVPNAPSLPGAPGLPSPPQPPPLAPQLPVAPASPDVVEVSPPEEPDSPPPQAPPPSPAQYECRNKGFFYGTYLPGTPIKLRQINPRNQTQIDTNVATCRNFCDARPDCFAFSYKVTGFCFLLGRDAVFADKIYSTAVLGCKVIGSS